MNQRSICLTIFSVLGLMLSISTSFATDDDDSALLDDADKAGYGKHADRVEKESGINLSKYLTATGSLEIEKRKSRGRFRDPVFEANESEYSKTLEISLVSEPTDFLGVEFSYDVEDEKGRVRGKTDEVFLYADFERISFSIGRQTTPFGEFYSSFIEGALIEFAETKADSLIADVNLSDAIVLSAFAINSQTRRANQSSRYDWGTSIAFENNDGAFLVKASYLSNLAESDEDLLNDFGGEFEKRVAAYSLFALYGWSRYEITAETVKAATRFTEFETNTDRPAAFNIEFSVALTDSFFVTARLENSEELEDAPRKRYGLSTSWSVTPNLSFSAEYLKARYKTGFVINDEDESLSADQLVNFQVRIAF